MKIVLGEMLEILLIIQLLNCWWTSVVADDSFGKYYPSSAECHKSKSMVCTNKFGFVQNLLLHNNKKTPTQFLCLWLKLGFKTWIEWLGFGFGIAIWSNLVYCHPSDCHHRYNIKLCLHCIIWSFRSYHLLGSITIMETLCRCRDVDGVGMVTNLLHHLRNKTDWQKSVFGTVWQ